MQACLFVLIFSHPPARACVSVFVCLTRACVYLHVDEDDITFLRLKDRKKWIACYISVGTLEDWRSDIGDLPPDAVGEPLGDWEGENYLDITNTVRAAGAAVAGLACTLGYRSFQPSSR